MSCYNCDNLTESVRCGEAFCDINKCYSHCLHDYQVVYLTRLELKTIRNVLEPIQNAGTGKVAKVLGRIIHTLYQKEMSQDD